VRTKLFGDVAISGGVRVPRDTNESGRTKRPSLYVADSLSPDRLGQGASMIDDVPSLEVAARNAFVERIENGDKLVVDFIAFHRDELDPRLPAHSSVTRPRRATRSRVSISSVSASAKMRLFSTSASGRHTRTSCSWWRSTPSGTSSA
jgi:hypothetical protein